MFEGITVSPVFAHFFLGFIRGGYNFMNAVNDLESLDPELYKNLVFLRTYEGDVADLGLSFTVVDEDMGKNTEVELIENGANIAVTNDNKCVARRDQTRPTDLGFRTLTLPSVCPQVPLHRPDRKSVV